MPDPKPASTDNCIYRCVEGQWVLVGGAAPPGYRCPELDGMCYTPGSTIETPPIPISPPDPPASMAPQGIYNYDPTTRLLHFSNGSPTQGFGFANQLSLEECLKLYPELAPKFQEIQASLDLSGLKLELPGLPIQKIAEWYKSKSAKGLA